MGSQICLNIRRSSTEAALRDREVAAHAGIVQAPTVDYLDLLNSNDRSPHRSIMDAQPWTCCGEEVPPVGNRLVDTPSLICPKCYGTNLVPSRFRLTDMTVNEVSLDMAILNQKSKPYCSLYACALMVLLSLKLKVVRSENSPLLTIPIDMELFAHEFFQYFVHGEGSGAYIPLVLAYLQMKGLPPKVNQGTLLQQPLPPPVPNSYITIKHYFSVDPSDVFFVTRLLGSGYPLVGIVRSGRRMYYATGGEVYYTTDKDRDEEYPDVVKESFHAVALIGCGGPDLKPIAPPCYEMVYDIQDSWGPYVHPSEPLGFQGQGGQGFPIGGKYRVWSSDVLSIYGVFV